MSYAKEEVLNGIRFDLVFFKKLSGISLSLYSSMKEYRLLNILLAAPEAGTNFMMS